MSDAMDMCDARTIDTPVVAVRLHIIASSVLKSKSHREFCSSTFNTEWRVRCASHSLKKILELCSCLTGVLLRSIRPFCAAVHSGAALDFYEMLLCSLCHADMLLESMPSCLCMNGMECGLNVATCSIGKTGL